MKVDPDELDHSLLRGFYMGWINRHPYLPKDFKENMKTIARQHFAIMIHEISLIELAWRRTECQVCKKMNENIAAKMKKVDKFIADEEELTAKLSVGLTNK